MKVILEEIQKVLLSIKLLQLVVMWFYLPKVIQNIMFTIEKHLMNISIVLELGPQSMAID